MKWKSWFTETWKNWGDHPLVVIIASSCAIVGTVYLIYGAHFKTDPKDLFSERVSYSLISLKNMSPNSPVKFPLGINKPISTPQNTGSTGNKLDAIQYYDRSSKTFKDFIPIEMVDLIKEHKDFLYSRVSGVDSKTDTVFTINLKVYDHSTGQTYAVEHVDVSDLVRDIMNATIDLKLTRLEHK
jgi:hypothetical protein